MIAKFSALQGVAAYTIASWCRLSGVSRGSRFSLDSYGLARAPAYKPCDSSDSVSCCVEESPRRRSQSGSGQSTVRLEVDSLLTLEWMASGSQTMSLSRSVSPPRPARNPLRLPPNSNAVSHGRGILGRKNSGSSKSSSTRSIATGLVASVASWQAESRTTLSNSDSNPLAAVRLPRAFVAPNQDRASDLIFFYRARRRSTSYSSRTRPSSCLSRPIRYEIL